MEDFLTRASKSVPTMAGIKFSSADLLELRRCILLDDGKFQILFGRDEVAKRHLLFEIQSLQFVYIMFMQFSI